ncbi:MAG TPA: hypothetical protein VMU94_09225 [Streptosporangiaceae bacterium]|nr:hypothetical protein [Streptosporangiaceae bacterium]
MSQPGLGPVIGARVPAESGDDPARHASRTLYNETTAWPQYAAKTDKTAA